MANYDRGILVPYLRDVCCAEMMCRKLERDVSFYKTEADKYTRWANQSYEYPKVPNQADYMGGDESAQSGMAVPIGICLIGCMLMAIPILGIPLIIYGAIGVWTFAEENKEVKRRAEKRYADAVEVYRKKALEYVRCCDSIPGWRAAAQRYRDQEHKARTNLQQAKSMRDRLYSVNIIPSRYRTIHAAYYLYDFFETGQETDLERTIQTMLLDEIIQRMDKLIVQNQEILLNQRRQLALQESQNKRIDDNHRQAMQRIAKMEQNQELQVTYQKMIERNQEVTNFFLAADYLRKN